MKQLRSFRLRIALLSAALAGSTLVGFGAVSWFQIYNAKISRLDAELLNQLIRASRPSERERSPIPRRSLSMPPARSSLRPELLSFGSGTNIQTPIALLILDANGNTVSQSNSLATDIEVSNLLVKRLQLTPLPPPPPRERPNSSPFRPLPLQFVTAQTATATWRIGAAKFPNTQVAIAVSLQVVNLEMASIRNIFLVSIPVALLMVAIGAWLISGGALRPIGQLTGVIQQVTVKGLDQRIPIGTTDVEFVELIQVFNQMLSRLERSFTQASRFSADAAHELKTPLTILQGELERTLQQVDSGSEVQQRLSNLLDEVRRLSGIIRKLLLLSLADAGQMSLYLVEVDMSQLLMEMVEDVELLAPHLSLQTDIPAGLKVQGDRDLLMQVLQNLLSNAIKYNLADGWIKIYAQQKPTNIHITIANASKDIPASDRDRLFDRFYRGDPAHTRKVEGLGLGLSLAREIARAHRGNLTLNSISEAQTAFTFTLPLNVIF
ncbi:HAMP domain-containing protein [Anabaena cylindrica FACHB-243]|uniref:histidine kinase n=1 Tax=Anabaena cylindrica (strain ATCC 27899 / PCC 7122) TaxID=272123 RepID=K9ZNJ3_ANACC|nr:MULTISPECIES: ATP-binding protein [Anabaena]AFZ60761.1 integral membrane sensor signal transduction histidine kinase [Anabaena cylindrica PCC 7122]MBD2419804.1 HAMP domain-containing protein [Anabaena cylindrica FACHB-243]MBY5281335.1 HAMP domain-containing protein [Anabaena sp. CCAP 1446/1C]MBY5309016.1 HAMP domain-containing protein [Anabaena sp. CCAP 1446/1C]MCM2406761.1 ATP-binding protein [Anabaena sp. CCAP 1446/1C]